MLRNSPALARLAHAMTENITDWQAALGLAYAPSTFQAAIFDFVAHGTGNGVVEAVAGSGKTTTIVWAAKLITEAGLFLAFNKVIADMLGARLKGTSMSASTVHSHGFAAIRSALGRVKVDAKKYRAAVDAYESEIKDHGTLIGDDCSHEELAAIDDEGFPRSEISKLIDLARLGLVDCDGTAFDTQLLALADHHRIDFDPKLNTLVVDCVRLAMQWGQANVRVVDFTDMVWLPTVLGLRPATYAWIFVDECQDISAAHLELIRRSIKRGGRALFVGDPRQAIYGFAGADAASFSNIIRTMKATVLPLSVCYRCATSVIALAQEITPQIQARPGAPTGTVRSSTDGDFIDGAREGDMVLCRLNAPLLSLAFKLIASGTRAGVRGRDIGAGLGKVVSDCAKRSAFEDFRGALDRWEDGEIDGARKRFRDEDALAMRIEAIQDQAECIRIIHASSGAKTASELKAAIERLFADDKPAVVLSSVHRAKGLEAERIFIAKPERLGVARAGARQWMVEQEQNLEYVAYTRALSELVFLDGTSSPREKAPVPTDHYELAATAYEAGDDEGATAHLTACTNELKDQAPECPASESGRCYPESDWHCHWCDRNCDEQMKSGPVGGHMRITVAPADPVESSLPPVDANAPPTYDPSSRAARVALARRFDVALRVLGFAPVHVRGTAETVYHRESGGQAIRVFSTIVAGEVRGLGKDAIRVCPVNADGRPLDKTRRVNRVGLISAIVERVQERIEHLSTRGETG